MAERTIESGGRKLTFDAARMKQVGLAGGGGGHIGIFVPVIETAGWKLRMQVDGGPAVALADDAISFPLDPDVE
jgi:hypothetical protein